MRSQRSLFFPSTLVTSCTCPFPPALLPLFHLFSLFLLHPRVCQSPFIASFPPSLFLFPSLRLRFVPLLRAFCPSALFSCLPLSRPPSPFAPLRISLTCPPSRRPPPFQLDSLAAYPLSVARRRSLGVLRYLCSLPLIRFYFGNQLFHEFLGQKRAFVVASVVADRETRERERVRIGNPTRIRT